MGSPKITGEQVKAAGRFIVLKVLDWMDAKGVARQWETANRATDAGAVLIMARLRPSNRLLLIRQFRPPAGGYVFEFPAGLMNPGEEAETAALRELREETGYHAKVVAAHPYAFSTPGLSNESVYLVEAEVDENAPENQKPETEFDPGEMIETLLMPLGELDAFYRRESENGAVFDAKLAAFVLARAFD